MDGYDYFHYVDYNPFAELAAKVSFRNFLSNRLALNSSIGFGSKYMQAFQLSSGFSFMDTSITSSYQSETISGAAPFLLLQSTLLFKMKNSDLFGLNFSYHHSFRDLQAGNYKIATNTPDYSYGDFRAKGHQLTFGLSYIFTGYEKHKRSEAAGPGVKKQEVRKQLRQEYYAGRLGKSSSIRVYGAVFADQNTSTDTRGFIQSSRPPSLGAGLDFIREFRPNLFWEAGFNFHEYYNGLAIRHSDGFVSRQSTNAFNAKQISAGCGYIFRNKRLVPIINISAGAAIAFNTDMFGFIHNSRMSIGMPGDPSYVKITMQDQVLRGTFPLLYAGLRKDIRIRGRLFLSPEFKYYQGLTKVHESRIIYTTTDVRPELINTTVFMRGSYFQYGLGLKLDL